jgi:hypothetical protein
MKKLFFFILVLMLGVGAGLLAKRTVTLNKQIDNGTVQICPPDCFPEKKTCG